MAMRYMIALGVAAFLIILAIAAQWRMIAIIEEEVRQRVRQEKEAGTLPAEVSGIDPETADLTDFGTELPGHMVFQITIVDALRSWWFVWMPLIVLTCLGVAYLVPTKKRP